MISTSTQANLCMTHQWLSHIRGLIHSTTPTIGLISIGAIKPSPNIVRQLPKTIEQRLSNNSSNEAIFNKAAPLHEKPLSEGDYDVKLKYNPNKKTKQKKNRKTNIICFNPSYS